MRISLCCATAPAARLVVAAIYRAGCTVAGKNRSTDRARESV